MQMFLSQFNFVIYTYWNGQSPAVHWLCNKIWFINFIETLRFVVLKYKNNHGMSGYNFAQLRGSRVGSLTSIMCFSIF